MSRLPQVTARQMLAALQRAGFIAKRTKGSRTTVPSDGRDGKEIYRCLREELEARHYGAYVMIYTRTEEYVLGRTTSEVHSRFIERFGVDASGWCTRVGVSVFATA